MDKVMSFATFESHLRTEDTTGDMAWHRLFDTWRSLKAFDIAKSFNDASNLYKFAKAYDGLDEGGFTPESMVGKKQWIQVDHSECGNYDNVGEKPVKMADPLTIEANPDFVRKNDR